MTFKSKALTGILTGFQDTLMKQQQVKLPLCPIFHHFLVGAWRRRVVAVQFCAYARLLPRHYEASASPSHPATILQQ